jgi:sugar O-acyltransferase (sialic acid O-acetyltransferase NeuD family)
MNKKIAILGAGGHGKVVGEIAALNDCQVIDFFDDAPNILNKNFPFPIIGNSQDLKKNFKYYELFFVAIGDNIIRKEKMLWLSKIGLNFANLIHPKSIISKNVSLGKGISVMANAVINTGSSISDGAIINTSAVIDHDCIIHEFAHISPNCALSGGVNVGELTHVGTGTSVHPLVKIGKNVKIGIGNKIFKNLGDNQVFNN